jgi:uncharacterized repeat protein (TIGR01451 family)
LSLKTVTPTLVTTAGETLFYEIVILNTGAYTAVNATLSDPIPANTTYNNDATASSGPAPTFGNNTVSWTGDVGFDTEVIVSFSVDVDAAYEGTIENTAVISQPLIAEPVTVTAATAVTNDPIFTIEKNAIPTHPGANKPMTYTITVANVGQTAVSVPLTVRDELPVNTTFLSTSPDGGYNGGTNTITWNRTVTMALGETSVFTFAVNVGNVPSGTVLTNDNYDVNSPVTNLTAGESYTTTVIAPIFLLSKEIWPDPPGSNREMTYMITVLNVGSLATDLVVTDDVPDNTTYVSGGSQAGGTVTWNWPKLDMGESAEFTFTVYIDDITNIDILNDTYEVCSSEGVCQSGAVVTSTILPAQFAATSVLNPIAKKPGGGGGPVTPTLAVHNLGPGNALDATALLKFHRISVQLGDIQVIPTSGALANGPDCGDQCNAFLWVGDLNYGETVTFTTYDGQNTIGGEEGTLYTATVIITDSLSNITTEPVTATAVGHVTHLANLIPTKEAPSIIGRGQLMTYTINVWNSALSTDEPPPPTLTDTVPLNTTFVSASNGGTATTVAGRTVVAWTLPALSTGETLRRSFVVEVDDDLISGTQIINDDYRTAWYELEDSLIFSNTGQPVTTTVREVGLIDSYKEVTPALALPGPNNVLTFYLHIVNSSPNQLNNVMVYDTLPWQNSTYQRDAVASAGQVISDIVSVEWGGNVAPFSEEIITLTVLVDDGYEGAITNTAVIDHPSLLEPVIVHAVAYITDDPVLQISKRASPDPVDAFVELLYTIKVVNLGQQASQLVVTDTIPVNTTYVPGSASAGGQLVGGMVRWQFSVLKPAEERILTFRVTVDDVEMIVNEFYGVRSAEGVMALGQPVTTLVNRQGSEVYLPFISKQ